VRHIDLPEQVVGVEETIYVKVIDIDLDRRRISLSLKQANEGVDPEAEEFLDPALYGMLQEYDEDGNYKYPEGFDPETNEWLEGFETQREEWEQQYAQAQHHWEEHKKQVAKAISADADAAASASVSTESAPPSYASEAPAQADAGTLASDEALAALREKLAGS